MPGLRFFVFLGMIALAVGVMTAYAELRLVRDPGWPPRATAIAKWTLRGLAVVAVVAVITFLRLRQGTGHVFAWTGLVWFGTLFVTFAILLVIEIPRRLAIRAAAGPPETVDLGRRRLLTRGIAVAAGAAAAATSGVAVVQAVRKVGVTHVRVPLDRLPPEFDGFKIAQLSDLHVGPTLGRGWLEEVVGTVNALEPDLVAITGDVVDGSIREIGDLVAPLADLRSRHGTFLCTGNHDFYSGVDAWVARFRGLGIRVLRNERAEVADGGAAIDVAGVDDYGAAMYRRGEAADMKRALSGRDAERFVVLLAHQPRHLAEAIREGVDLQLSGHTHGGQIWPFGFVVSLVQPVVRGLEKHGKTWIYVNSGTGFWGPPMRLGVPAEVTLLELRRAAGDRAN